MARTLPYDVNIQDLLNELLEYMEDRQDADHDGDNFVANKEMKFAQEIEQALFQIQNSNTEHTEIYKQALKEALNPLKKYALINPESGQKAFLMVSSVLLIN